MEEGFRKTHGNQPGDLAKGVARIIEAVTLEGYAKSKKIPDRITLGGDAYEMAGQIFERIQKDREEWKEWANDTWRDDLKPCTGKSRS